MRSPLVAGALALAATVPFVACQMPQAPHEMRAGAPAATTAAGSSAVYAAGGVPSGTIVAYFGSELPAGWVYCDGKVTPNGRRTPDLRGRFVMGLDPAALELLGQTGGSDSHQHAADTGPERGEAERIEEGRDEHVANDNHSHPVTVRASSHLPPFARLAYIMKD